MMVSVEPQVSARAGTEYISAVSMKFTPRQRTVQDGVRGFFVDLFAEGHGAQADGGHAQVAGAELNFIHGSFG
jgi:nanoRNase/pAp phosphatase (c-di-AMP/oligoRNAs hydrolase)